MKKFKVGDRVSIDIRGMYSLREAQRTGKVVGKCVGLVIVDIDNYPGDPLSFEPFQLSIIESVPRPPKKRLYILGIPIATIKEIGQNGK